MSNALQKIVKLYSTGSHTSHHIKTNIIGGTGSDYSYGSGSAGRRGGNANSSIVGDKYLSNYFGKTREFEQYEISKITDTIVEILSDYIIGFLSKEPNLISIDSDEPKMKAREKWINQQLKTLDIRGEIKSNIRSIIYYGSYSFSLDWDKKTSRFTKKVLISPNNVVSTYMKGELRGFLVQSKGGEIKEITSKNIMRLGREDLELINDIKPEYFHDYSRDDIYSEEKLVASLPLYYSMAGKIKDFILKDYIVSLLSIKDLVQPLLLLLTVNKNTDVTTANNLALKTENLINKYADISSIISAGFSVQDLMDSLLNNIRVIPDWDSELGNVNTLDISKIMDRVSQLKSEIQNDEESILNSVGIPPELYYGRANKWDSLNQSERLKNRINKYIVAINTSVENIANHIYYYRSGKYLDKSLIKSRMFLKTPIEYGNEKALADSTNDLMRSFAEIIGNAEQLMSSSKLIKKEPFLAYIKGTIKDIEPSYEELIVEKIPSDVEDSELTGESFGGYSAKGKRFRTRKPEK